MNGDIAGYAQELLSQGVTRDEAVDEVDMLMAWGDLPLTPHSEVVSIIDGIFGTGGETGTGPPPEPEPETGRMSIEIQPDGDPEPIIRFVDLTGECGKEPEPLEYVVDGLLPRERILQIVAKGGSGKTQLGVELTLAVATGGTWLGFRCERGRVAYIDPELHEQDARRRVSAVSKALGIWPGDVAGAFEHVLLRGTTATADTLLEAIREHVSATGRPFDLIVIDSLNAVFEGDENSSVDVRRFYADLQRLSTECHAAITVLHHSGKGGSKASGEAGRGSSVFLDAPDVCVEVMPLNVRPNTNAWEVLRVYDNGGVEASAWRMTFPKNRSGPPIKPIDLILKWPLHVRDVSGEFASCKVIGSDADNGSKGGDAKGEAFAEVWEQMDDMLRSIVGELQAEGTKATRAACLDVLNERREAIGLKRWSKATFRNVTLRNGKTRFRVDPATNELFELTDEELEAEGDTVPDTP